MAVKQHFIPAHILDQIISVDAAESEKVKATVNGDYVAIAGVKADRISRVFDEADPNDPSQPDMDIMSDPGISPDPDNEGFMHVGDTVSAIDAGITVASYRSTTLWQIVNPNAPDTILASSATETWTIPDTSAGGGARSLRLTLTYQDRYSSRDLPVVTEIPIQSNSGAPSVQAPTISGAGAVGTNGTIAPGAMTGSPTPTATYQLYADGSPFGSPFSGMSFAFASAGVTYTVKQIATNTNGTATSDPSNGIKAVTSTVTAPSWTEAWGELTELMVAPEGRLNVEIKAAATFSNLFDYFVYTSDVEETSAVDVRRYGAKITAANTSYVRSAKPKGTVVYPRIVAIDKTVTTDGVGGVFVLSKLSYATGYAIQGITVETSARSMDFPSPPAAVITQALSRPYENCYLNKAMACTDMAYEAHTWPIIGLAAYNGDASAQTKLVALLKRWRENTASKTDVPTASAWTSLDPIAQGTYPAIYELSHLVDFICAIFTPAVYDALPAEGKLAACAYIEWIFAIQLYGLANATATNPGGGTVLGLMGKTNIWKGGGEPNIVASSHFSLVLSYGFFQTVRGKDYLATRGFTSLDDWFTNWRKGDFADFLNSNTMRVGQVPAGKRVCDNMYRMASLASALDPGNKDLTGYDDPPPSNATMRSAWRIGAGRTGWKTAEQGHSLADTQGIVTRFMNRCFGMEVGAKDDLGIERSGTPGDLLDLANPNKTANPATGNGGKRTCRPGLRWHSGFAMYSSINAITATGQIDTKTITGPGTNPDFKGGIPFMKQRADASYTQAQKDAAWSISNGVFGNRRGRVMAETYGPCPFLGQTGPVSEIMSVDTGSFYNSSTSYTAGQRSSMQYAKETIAASLLVQIGLAVLQQGPKNLLNVVRGDMSGNWSSGDAGWTVADRPNSNWYSAKTYSYGYTAGQTGTSGELVMAASAVVAGRSYLHHIQTQMTSGAGSVTLAARFFESGGAQVGPDVEIYSGALGTTLLDKEKLIATPTGATTYSLVAKVAKGSTTGIVRIGGPGLRYAPVSLVDWNAEDLQETLKRARRGLIFARYCLVNGWYDIAKMAFYALPPANASKPQGSPSPSNSGDTKWSSGALGSHQWFTLMGTLINSVIPYWRKNISDFPAYGDGYTDWNWEATVTSAANSGLVAK